MSGLSLKIRVITHDRIALENMLEYKVDNALLSEWKRRKSANATIGKVFFKGCNIEEFSHARHMYYIEAGDCAIERSYFPTIMLIERALNGRGMIYAEGFDDGSGMDGVVIWAWDHVLTLGEANSEIKELKRSGRFPNVKFQTNAGAFLRKSIEYLMYYDQYLPAELKEDYLIHQQEAMKAISAVRDREKERFLRRQAQLLDREAARSRRSKTIEFAGRSFAFHSVIYMEEEHCSEYTPDIDDIFEEKLNARGAIMVESGMEDYYVMEVEEDINPAEHEIFSDHFSADYRNDKVQHVCEGDVWKALKETTALLPDEAEFYIKQAKQTIEQRIREDRQIALDRIRDHVGADGFGEQGVPEIRGQLFCLCDVKRTKYRGIVHMANLLEQELRKRGAASIASLQKCADCIVYDGEDWLPERSEEFAQKYSVRLMTLSDLWRAIFATTELSGAELAAMPSNEEIRQQKKREQETREAAQKEAARLQRQQEREEAKRQAELMRPEEKEKAKADKEARLKAEQDRKAAQIRQAEEEKQKQEEARLQKIERTADERERRIREEVLYRPGEEPESIRRRIAILFPKLDGAYPDKVIRRLSAEHGKWAETVTELYRQLGYPDGRAFLEAYGYTVEENKGGRPSTVNVEEVLAELKRRYADGAHCSSVAQLKEANPDLPLKGISNKAKELFGMPLGQYLKELGILT